MKEVVLIEVPKTDYHLRGLMNIHYSQPKGFIGRSLCYLVTSEDVLYGGIVGGSATLHLPGRNEFLGVNKSSLGSVINNIFYHVEKQGGKYPFRNFTEEVLKTWRERVSTDWKRKYHDSVVGFESLVQLPRTGELYLRDGWTLTGTTVGNTCKRVAGRGSDSWSGKRVWDTKNLKPKLVFCKRRELCGIGSDQHQDENIDGTISTSSLLTTLVTENSEVDGFWGLPPSSTLEVTG